MRENKVKVELTNSEAELFKKFRQHQNDFEVLLNAGFFNFKNGCATSYRDPAGILKNIEIKILTFTRKKKKRA